MLTAIAVVIGMSVTCASPFAIRYASLIHSADDLRALSRVDALCILERLSVP